MNALSTPVPDANPALQRLLSQSRTQLAERPQTRERDVEMAFAIAFLCVAMPIAALLGTGRALDPVLAAGLVALYAIATRVEFRMASGWTDPSELVLVPMLFLLPTAAVPLFVAAALLLSRIPDYLKREVHAGRAILRIGDAWYVIWPVLVLTLAGATTPDWSDWPIYVAALVAQFVFDAATTTIRVSTGIGVAPKTVLGELRAIYATDALLAPVGLLTAFAATAQPWTALLILPLIGLLRVFAHEREARIEGATALTEAYQGTAHLLGDLLSTSDEYTGSHTQGVVALAQRVGEEIGLDENGVREVELAALLHDVGKISVPKEILNKPGKLTEAEMDVMRQHTIVGQRMLERVGGVLGEVGKVVRSHHERWDGGGYPDGLRGPQIPVGSRVVAACDAFNAMTTDRPYRKALSFEVAIGELVRESGAQFDPRVTEALIGILAELQEPDEPATERELEAVA